MLKIKIKKKTNPGTPTKRPFLPANSSLILTCLPGLSSKRVESGSWLPSFKKKKIKHLK